MSSIAQLEKFSFHNSFYNVKDKLYLHVMRRTEAYLQKADKIRNEIKTPEELKAHVDRIRECFIREIGGIPYDPTLPLNAKTTGYIEEENLTIENVIFESRPGIFVTATLYIPKKRKNPCGAVLFQCGHAQEGRLYAQYQRVARIIAMSGVIVLLQDPMGQGERKSYFEPSVQRSVIDNEHQYLGNQCHLVGDSIVRYFIGDAMRSIDYLVSRPEVDSGKIGLTGSSGGGTMTTLMMLCDPRAVAAAPGTFVSSRLSIFYSGRGQDAEQIWPGAVEYGLDHHELLMSFAPKPLLLLTVDSDFFPKEGSHDVYAETKRFWEMFDSGENLRIVEDASLHAFTDTLARHAGSFFAEVLNGESTFFTGEVSALSAQRLYATEAGNTLVIPGAKSCFDENRKRFVEKDREKDAVSWLKKQVYKAREVEGFNVRRLHPEYVNGLSATAMIWFSQKLMPCTGWLFKSFDKEKERLPITICLWEDGTNSLTEHIHTIRNICNAGRAALVLDVSGIGQCAPHSSSENEAKSFCGYTMTLNSDLIHMHDSLCALRTFDLLRSVDMLKEQGYKEVNIYAEGRSAVYAKIAQKLHPTLAVETVRMISPTAIVNDKFYEDYNIYSILMPGISLYLEIEEDVD